MPIRVLDIYEGGIAVSGKHPPDIACRGHPEGRARYEIVEGRQVQNDSDLVCVFFWHTEESRRKLYSFGRGYEVGI